MFFMPKKQKIINKLEIPLLMRTMTKWRRLQYLNHVNIVLNKSSCHPRCLVYSMMIFQSGWFELVSRLDKWISLDWNWTVLRLLYSWSNFANLSCTIRTLCLYRVWPIGLTKLMAKFKISRAKWNINIKLFYPLIFLWKLCLKERLN